jgi:hypothetical protein
VCTDPANIITSGNTCDVISGELDAVELSVGMLGSKKHKQTQNKSVGSHLPFELDIGAADPRTTESSDE